MIPVLPIFQNIGSIAEKSSTNRLVWRDSARIFGPGQESVTVKRRFFLRRTLAEVGEVTVGIAAEDVDGGAWEPIRKGGFRYRKRDS